jgi:TrmH RNA methyltransferase
MGNRLRSGSAIWSVIVNPHEREQTVYGRKACWAIFAHRPRDILRVFHSRALRQEAAPLAKWAASAGLPCRELSEEELLRVAGSTHHEGLVLGMRPRRYGELDGGIPGRGMAWVALDQVENPFNVGAILRSCAFFGVERVMMGGVQPGSAVNSAALRSAEGGAEALQLVAAQPLAPALLALGSQGVAVIGLESDANDSLDRASLTLPAVLVLGHEQKGLSHAVRGACTQVCAIVGRGPVTSLNVSVTAGIALAMLFAGRTRPQDEGQPVRETRRQRPRPAPSAGTRRSEQRSSRGGSGKSVPSRRRRRG